MAEMLIQSESLTSIANKIRVLSGTEDSMSLNAMENHINEANENVNTESELISQIMTVLRGKTNIEIPEVVINTATAKLSSNGTSISFTGLSEEPKMFAICPTGNISLGTTRYVTSVIYDGTTTQGTYGYRSGSTGTSYYSSSYFTWTYTNGTLTVKTSSSTNGGNFSSSVTYQLAYVNVNPSGGSVDGGVQLPILINEGVASDLASGKQLINSNGEIVTGTHECAGSGIDVKTATGQIRTSGGSASATCGFKPDMVSILLEPDNEGGNGVVAFNAVFNDDFCYCAAYCNSFSYQNVYVEVEATSNGFRISGFNKYTDDWDSTTSSGETYSYIAIKYTA